MLELTLQGDKTKHQVIDDCHLTIQKGDRICLMGPSGVGKSTLLNALAGLESGVSLQCQDDLRVGYLFQEHRLLPWRTLLQNLMLAGASMRNAEFLLDQVGLGGYGGYLPNQLSLGMTRRASLARCLVIRPRLLLLDEPFASLDQDRVQSLRCILMTLLDQNPDMAMVCTTHSEMDASALANRVWRLEGRPACLRRDDTGALSMPASSAG